MQLPFTLRQLNVFASLCATRSFRRTAEILGISQAAVSNQVKTLETQLGVALFERRSGRRPALTAAGVAFEADLRSFRAAAETLAGHRRRTAEEVAKPLKLRILVGQILFDDFIRATLGQFLSAHPQIELQFESRPPSDALARDLESGQYDFALIHARADLPVESYLRPLALLRGGVYGHRKFGKGHALPLPVDVINTLPFIFPSEATAAGRETITALSRRGIEPQHIVGHTEYYDVIGAMLDGGIGIASFADFMLRPEMRDRVILLHPLENWRLLWYRKDAGADPRHQAVQDFLWSSVLGNPGYTTLEVFV